MENIYTAARPLYILTKVLGLFLLTQEGPTAKGLFKLKWHGIVYCLLTLLLPVALIVLIVCHDAQVDRIIQAWIIFTNFDTLLLCSQFFYQTGKRNSILNFLEAVNEFDRKVVKLNLFHVIVISMIITLISGNVFESVL